MSKNNAVELNNKKPRRDIGLSERARQRLQGLAEALEASNTPQMYFPNVRSGKKTRSEIVHDAMLKIRFMRKQAAIAIRERQRQASMARALARA